VNRVSHLVRELRADDVPGCEKLLAGLPDWFGHEESNREYINGLLSRPSAVVEASGRIAGFVSIERHNEQSAEIHVAAVDREHHREGFGGALVAWTESWCVAEGIRWLHVKTRGPSTPDPNYERTRHFWLASGFEPLFETLALWGPQNAALILVKTIATGESAS
jgi:GNAT superfamily N-acetyltransferase